MLRIEVDIKDKAADASKRDTMVLPPLELSQTPGPSRRQTVESVPQSTTSVPAVIVQAPSIASATSEKKAMRGTVKMATKSPQGSISSGGSRGKKVTRFLHGGKSMLAAVRPRKRRTKTLKPPQDIRSPSVGPLSPVSPTSTDPGNGLAEFTLPAEAIELDILDCDAIPALIAGVLRGTNVNEFLERLEVLAYTGKFLDFICCLFFSIKCFR